MSKRFTICTLLCLLALPAAAREYQSAFGFTLDASDNWLVLTPKELQDNPRLLELDSGEFGSVDAGLMKQVIGMVKAGQVEFYLNRKTSEGGFADNVNFLTQSARLPMERNQLKELCELLPAELSRVFGRPIQMYRCTFGRAGDTKAVVTEFDGMMDGTRSIQYQFHKSPGVVVVATATAKNSTVEIIRAEFEQMMGSVRLTQ